MAGAASIGGWRRGELEGLGNGDLERAGKRGGFGFGRFVRARGAGIEFGISFRFGREAPANHSKSHATLSELECDIFFF